MIARTGGALLLSSLYVYLHASLAINESKLRDLIESRSTRPALVGATLITVGGIWWYAALPESAKAVLASAAVLNVLMVLIFVLTAAVFLLLYLGPYRNPGWLSPGFAAALCLFGIAAFSTGEFIREAVRKPYIVYNVVLGNQILPEEIPTLKQQGCLEGGVWPKAFVRKNYPQLLAGGTVDQQRLPNLGPKDQIKLGRVLFQYQCNNCHAPERGYSAVGPLLRGRSREMVESLVKELDQSYFFMPPWAGTPEEASLLAGYLMEIAPSRPQGMVHASAAVEAR